MKCGITREQYDEAKKITNEYEKYLHYNATRCNMYEKAGCPNCNNGLIAITDFIFWEMSTAPYLRALGLDIFIILVCAYFNKENK